MHDLTKIPFYDSLVNQCTKSAINVEQNYTSIDMLESIYPYY